MVKQAAVTVRPDDRGEDRLVAYMVVHADADAGNVAAALREHVERLLPSVMVPSAFVTLAELPLTTSGKTDRRALPAPETWCTTSAAPIAPRNATESAVCDIYADVLGARAVSVHDDFFALGGHSLLASRVVSRIRAELNCDLPLRTLFDDRTPARLAQAIDAASVSDVPAIVARARTTPAPLSLAQQQMLGIRESLVDLTVFPVSPYGFRLRGPIDRGVLDRALTRIVARHEPLRTGFRDGGHGLVQVVRDPVPVSADLVDAAGTDPDDLVREVLGRPFDLVDGVLLRAVLIRLDEDDHTLVLVLHHLAGDGWSFDVLVRELSALYTELASGPLAELPEVTTTYSDFALWEHDVLSGPVRAEHQDYWLKHLSGATSLALPADRPRGRADAVGRSLAWTISPEITSAARRLADTEGVTLYETMLGAFAVAAAGLSGRDDVLVATPFANRGRPEIDHLIGFFAKVAALRVDLTDDPPFRTVLQRVHTAMLGAHAHQDIPYASTRAAAPGLPPALVEFQLISSLASGLILPGVHTEQFWMIETDLGIASGELAMWFFDDDGALHGTAVFDGSLFDPGTIRTLLATLESTLRVVSATPAVRVSEAHVQARS